ncbi:MULTISPECIES: hypothetical protein [unclassified Bradyrhizobium]|uniref:hypothetical protein n=1 Tax=unclassified Bradyrhizobium TaxID=2631580 RepID=UPI00244D3719|nr:MULTISPECIES: hypothetical protein [unclassified Bradyrhizobium]MDH2348505.1 hypothetical protein [Bradyrhizobium sp. SSUT77]MDH2357348.1 hypothetical protein [Bradyrhizobium sp. SSUT112]
MLLLLGNALTSLGDIGACIGDLAFQTVGGALQLQNSWTRDQAAFNEWRNVPGLTADGVDLIRKGFDLRVRTNDLRAELIDRFPDHAALTFKGRASAFELADLAVPATLQVRIVGPRPEIVRHHECGSVIELGQ